MNFWYELNYTFRALNQKRSFTLICILVIALGFAITIPLYSIVRNAAFAPLPFPDGDRIVTFKSGSFLEMNSDSFDVFQFAAIKDNASSFDILAMERNVSTTLSDGDIARVFSGTRIDSDALELSETLPAMGRVLLASDSDPSAEPVVLISDYVWQSYYESRADIIGSTSRINGESHTIVGVMPPGYSFPLTSDVWLPLQVESFAEPGAESPVQLLGKLKAGVTRESATLEIQAIMDRLAMQYPENYQGASAEVIPLIHRGWEGLEAISTMFGGLAICIFILVCLNVGNLLTIRANERVNELAIRTALGANRKSLLSHVMLESFLICLVGSVIGLLFAGGILGYLEFLISNPQSEGRGAPYWIDLGFPIDVLALSLLLIVLLWSASSFFAAWRATRVDVSVSLVSDAKGALSTESGRVIRGLVQLQVMLSFFLLVLSGVFVLEANSILDVSELPESHAHFTSTVFFTENSYESESERGEYRLQLRQRLLEYPDVEAVAFTASPPGVGGWGFVTVMEGEQTNPDLNPPRSGIKWVDEHYFPLIDAQELLEGRYFDSSDNISSQQVVIVDDKFVEQKQLSNSLVGQRIEIQESDGSLVETALVVGVVRNNLSEGIAAGAGLSPTVYRPIAQSVPPQLQLLVKAQFNESDSMALLDQRIRLTAASVDRDVPLSNLQSLEQVIEGNNLLLQFFLRIIIYSAVGALVLAIISIYGLISRSVVSRIFEIGIRRAIGSTDFSVVKIFLKQGLSYLLVAVLIGGGFAVLLINLVQSAYPEYGIFYSLAIALVVVTSVIAALIGYASYLPVRRVVALEPGEALHYE